MKDLFTRQDFDARRAGTDARFIVTPFSHARHWMLTLLGMLCRCCCWIVSNRCSFDLLVACCCVKKKIGFKKCSRRRVSFSRLRSTPIRAYICYCVLSYSKQAQSSKHQRTSIAGGSRFASRRTKRTCGTPAV